MDTTSDSVTYIQKELNLLISKDRLLERVTDARTVAREILEKLIQDTDGQLKK